MGLAYFTLILWSPRSKCIFLACQLTAKQVKPTTLKNRKLTAQANVVLDATEHTTHGGKKIYIHLRCEIIDATLSDGCYELSLFPHLCEFQLGAQE